VAFPGRLPVVFTACGDYQAAALDHRLHDRDQHALGDDHPDTLTSANNLAVDLYQLGDVQAAGTCTRTP